METKNENGVFRDCEENGRGKQTAAMFGTLAKTSKTMDLFSLANLLNDVEFSNCRHCMSTISEKQVSSFNMQ